MSSKKKKSGLSLSTHMSELRKSLRRNYVLYLFLLLPIIYFIVFKYIPMIGNVIAFRKFVPGQNYLGVSWEGFKYFKMFLNDAKFWEVFWNSIKLSALALVIGFPLPILFALLLNELTQKKFKKLAQSIAIVPRFLSTVVVVSMIKTILSPDTGVINKLITGFGGEAVHFVSDPKWFRTIYVLSDIWQFLGWSAIIYMAVLSSADQEQYEASRVDGANRLQQALHITLPVMLPTIAINLIIQLGNILNLGFEKVLLLYSPSVYETADIIQTYVYRMGITKSQFSYSTAVGIFQAVLSLSLLWFANKITNKYWDCGLW